MAFASFATRCNKYLSLVKNDDVVDLIVVFCILFVFMLVLYCFCVATEFSVNKDLYNYTGAIVFGAGWGDNRLLHDDRQKHARHMTGTDK